MKQEQSPGTEQIRIQTFSGSVDFYKKEVVVTPQLTRQPAPSEPLEIPTSPTSPPSPSPPSDNNEIIYIIVSSIVITVLMVIYFKRRR